MSRHFRTLFLNAACCVLAVGCAETGTGTGPLPVLKHDPVLFVPGYGGNNGDWQVMMAKFRADGWQDVELYGYNYSVTKSNASTAEEIRDQVDNIIRTTGASKVDIVAFSMGSVSSRYYLKNLGGVDKVDAWVSLAGPNHGTDEVANQACNFTPCKEIIPGSAFLTALNATDETPGLVRYATFRSPCDETINPDASVSLLGATNTQVACISHLSMLTDASVYSQVRAFIE
ncbi:MAG TPA: triacylglycerol lipase [Gemmatimonadaceae bacterium]|nr:triacylglycerol lipase [Gemmatimonadaceae bacterium]